MAIRTFNSAGGYSVGETPNLVISSTKDITANIGNFASNVSALNLLTDHIYYANGVPYNFSAASGHDYYVQFNISNNLASSANLTFIESGGVFPSLLTLVGTANISNLNVSHNAVINGNLTVNGSTTYINSASITVDDPLLKIGGANANSDSNLTSYDPRDRGLLIHNYDSSNNKAINEFFGWKNANGEFQAITDVLNYNSDVVTANSSAPSGGFANIRAQAFIGNLSGNILVSAQPNITSIGVLSSLEVNGNITVDGVSNGIVLGGGNISSANVISANTMNAQTVNAYTVNASYLYGDGSNLTNLSLSSATAGNAINSNYANYAGNLINGNSNVIVLANSNVTISIAGNSNVVTVSGNSVNVNGTVNATTFTGSLSTANQPNITSLGTLANLVVSHSGTGNITSDNAKLGNLATANYFTGVLTTANQPNITSIGSLSNLSINGNLTSTNANLGNLAVANYFSGDGSNLSNITGANVVGNVSSAITANFANYAGNVVNASQSNITSLGTLSGLSVSGVSTLGPITNVNITGGTSGQVITTDGTGNLSFETLSTSTLSNGNTSIGILTNGNIDFNVSGNSNVVVITGTGINVAGTANAAYFYGDGSNLTNITATGGTATNVSANVSNTKITGGTTNYVLAASDNLGDLTYANIANYFLVNTNITNVVPGSSLAFVANYANPAYPGGVYTLQQLGPVSMSMTDQWSQSGSNIGATKNSYSNYVGSITNLANVTVSFNLANATFNIQSTDYIAIGATTITGTQILSLATNINGNSSATFTIPSTNIGDSTEYNGLSTVTNSVSATLTNNRGSTGAGVNQATGTTLTSTAPIPFNVNSVSGSFTTNPIAFFSPMQTFNWSTSLTSGATVISGNLTYSNSSHSISGTLTSSGATSGTSTSLNSTYTYTLSTSDYTGSGASGAGTRTIPSTITGTVNSVNQYYPLFWQVTSSNTASTIINATSWNYGANVTGVSAHYGANLVVGAAMTGHYGVSTATSSDYLWIATPGSSTHTFHFIAANQDIPLPPDVGPLTGTLGSGSYTSTYTIYGFTKATSITNIYVST